MNRAAVVLAAATTIMALSATPAFAQEPTPPTEVTCYPLLSSFVCHIPVSVPVGPFEFIGPFVVIESIFPPSP